MLATPGTVNWASSVDVLKNKASNFNAIYNHIAHINTVPGTRLDRDKKQLLKKGRFIKSTLGNTLAGVDIGYRTSMALNGLGVVWLAPAAVIALSTASASITYWVTSARKFKSDNDSVNKLVDEGVSYRDAYNMVHRQKSRSIVPYFIGGVIGILLLPKIINKVKG